MDNEIKDLKEELHILKAASLADAGAPVEMDREKARRVVSAALAKNGKQGHGRRTLAFTLGGAMLAAAAVLAAVLVLFPQNGGTPGTLMQQESVHASESVVTDTTACDSVDFEIMEIDE